MRAALAMPAFVVSLTGRLSGSQTLSTLAHQTMIPFNPYHGPRGLYAAILLVLFVINSSMHVLLAVVVTTFRRKWALEPHVA